MRQRISAIAVVERGPRKREVDRSTARNGIVAVQWVEVETVPWRRKKVNAVLSVRVR